MSTEEDYVYMYFDPNEKFTSNIFSKKVFVRVANLHKPQPLVQINDLIFKGTYDKCIGTNLFFEEVLNPPPKTNIYEKETPICLKPLLKQTKLLRLQQMKLPKKIPATKHPQEQIQLDLNQDYEAVLKKLEQGLLNLEDLAVKQAESKEEFIENPYLNPANDKKSHTEPTSEIELHLGLLQDDSPCSLLEAKYEKLKRIARQPVLRIEPQESMEEPEEKWKSAYEYHNLERVLLQDTFFRSSTAPILAENYIGGVDFEGCKLQGVLANENIGKEQLNNVFSINNLHNLSIPGRYLVLKECVKQIEELLESSQGVEMMDTDESGRKIDDIYQIFKRLLAALERKLQTQEYKLELSVQGDDNECDDVVLDSSESEDIRQQTRENDDFH